MRKKSSKKARTPQRRSAKVAGRGKVKAPPIARRRVDSTIPMVCIGASAGGLEAIGKFLGGVSPNTRAAYVIIQHLDPTQKGMLPELVQRKTVLPVKQVRNGMPVKARTVYVIPPNKDMSILHDTLHLFDPAAPRGLRHPIDFFLRSLAEDRRRASVAVILSGMGSDGTLGARAIKAEGGLVLAQTPASADFDSMPRSVIDAQLADMVATPETLAAKIEATLQHRATSADYEGDATAGDSLDKIVILMRARTRHDFSSYKKSTLYRRIGRRLAIHQIDKMPAYVRFLRENPHEIDLLFNELLIGVTCFFRDPKAWHTLQEKVLPELIREHPNGKAFRAWVAGCSTGEEAYSLAIVFREALEALQPRGRFTLQIFATDLQQEAIAKARTGFFPRNIAADVSAERLNRWFIEEDGRFRVCKEIREMVTFAKQDLVIDPPFTKLDIIVCRNLLIYLEPEMQRRLIPLFHYSLGTSGVLFLGSAETVGEFSNLFRPILATARLYKRIEGTATVPHIHPSRTLAPADASGHSVTAKSDSSSGSLQSVTDHLLLQRYSPAAVLINLHGDILYTRGRTGSFLEPASGKANWNVHAMVREGLRSELMAGIQKALRTKSEVSVHGVHFEHSQRAFTVDIVVHYIGDPVQLRGMLLILFSEALEPTQRKPRSRSSQAAAMELALAQSREELRSMREEMQTSQEELESANEELQSINEELTTSKEEMQSMNEELQMVNQELQAKVDELSWASDDMKNLLNSTNIATIFLNNQLKIRRFTTQVTQIFKLIPSDIGRPLSDIVTDLQYADLQRDAQEVLRTLVYSEKQICTRDDRWFGVRIMPYRTTDNAIDGVVITFVDITQAKNLETQLRARIDKVKA